MSLQQNGRRILRGISLIRKLSHWRQAVQLGGRTTEAIFTDVYSHNSWGGHVSLSGTGSDAEQTQRIAQALPALFAEFDIRSLLDLPCGDFHWMKAVNLQGVTYLGGDIVEEMIAKNQQYRLQEFLFEN